MPAVKNFEARGAMVFSPAIRKMNLVPQSGASNLEIIVGRDNGLIHFHRLQAVDRFVCRPTARPFL